jgi:hypothetical protein
LFTIFTEPRIEGFLWEQLIIECDFTDQINVTFVALEINKERVQGFDLKNNKIYCTEHHVYYNMCLSQMNDSLASDNKMYFVINNASTHLNGSQSQCIVRYGSSLREDPRYPVKVIILKGSQNLLSLLFKLFHSCGQNRQFHGGIVCKSAFL